MASPASKRCAKIDPVLQSRPVSHSPLTNCHSVNASCRALEKDVVERTKQPPLTFYISSPRAVSYTIANISRPSLPRLD
jgi:hypothetical protein